MLALGWYGPDDATVASAGRWWCRWAHGRSDVLSAMSPRMAVLVLEALLDGTAAERQAAVEVVTRSLDPERRRVMGPKWQATVLGVMLLADGLGAEWKGPMTVELVVGYAVAATDADLWGTRAPTASMKRALLRWMAGAVVRCTDAMTIGTVCAWLLPRMDHEGADAELAPLCRSRECLRHVTDAAIMECDPMFGAVMAAAAPDSAARERLLEVESREWTAHRLAHVLARDDPALVDALVHRCMLGPGLAPGLRAALRAHYAAMSEDLRRTYDWGVYAAVLDGVPLPGPPPSGCRDGLVRVAYGSCDMEDVHYALVDALAGSSIPTRWVTLAAAYGRSEEYCVDFVLSTMYRMVEPMDLEPTVVDGGITWTLELVLSVAADGPDGETAMAAFFFMAHFDSAVRSLNRLVVVVPTRVV
jgi:hypothetical protein